MKKIQLPIKWVWEIGTIAISYLVVKYVRYRLYLDDNFQILIRDILSYLIPIDHFSQAECNISFQTIIFPMLVDLYKLY